MEAARNIEAWRVFCALGEGGGLKAASICTGTDLPACSRLVQKLEQEIGIALVDRSTRPCRLTAAGREFLPMARNIVRGYEDIRGRVKSLAGDEYVVRFSVPVNIPRRSVNQHIRTYAQFDPTLRVEVVSDLDHEDLLCGRAEAAYLPYRPPPEGLEIFPIGKSFNAPLATRSYLHTHPFPHCPRDLSKHMLIVRNGRHYPVTQVLEKDGRSEPVQALGIAFAGDVASGKEALLAGEGIALDLSISSCRREILSGELVPVMDGWHRPEWILTLAVPKGNCGNARLMRFIRWFASAESLSSRERRRENQKIISSAETSKVL